MSSNQGFWLKASVSAPLTQGRRIENLCCLLWSARGGVKSSIQCGPNPHSLPDWIWKLLRNVTLLSSQSCQRVYCMTILQEEIWCFVNFELSVNCVRVTEPSPAPPPSPPRPHPKLPEPRVNTKPRPQSSFTISDCQFYMPFEPVK